MTDAEFDAALLAAAFAHGAEEGWRHVSSAAAARRAGLDLALARARFAHPFAILKKFGEHADAHALAGAVTEGPVRDRLFDILLRRFDYLQMHRAGVLALLKIAPLAPGVAPYLAKATLCSMGWMLEGAGISAKGLRGALRAKGLLTVWAWGLRAWTRDESADLAATMAAVDVALNRAAQIASRFETDPSAAAQTQEDAAMEPELPLAGEDEPPAVL